MYMSYSALTMSLHTSLNQPLNSALHITVVPLFNMLKVTVTKGHPTNTDIM